MWPFTRKKKAQPQTNQQGDTHVGFTGQPVQVNPTSDLVRQRTERRLARLRQALQKEAAKERPDEGRMQRLNISVNKLQSLAEYYKWSAKE